MLPGHRATEFKQRYVDLEIHGVTLHNYRYAWAERAKVAGYPGRFAQLALHSPFGAGLAGRRPNLTCETPQPFDRLTI